MRPRAARGQGPALGRGTPIDRFVLARLEAEGLTPSPEAERTTLIRRVTLDLTGLPPTPAEVDAFLADRSPDAYEKAGRPPAGLAALRRAHGDGLARRRPLRRHQRLPERLRPDDVALARLGDRRLQPQPAVRPVLDRADRRRPAAGRRRSTQRIATGFNRNNRTVTEAGSIDEEWRVENAVDRVETTATVFLGLTMGCARCHDHKYDPISQKEFYQFFAFFNSVNEKGVYTETARQRAAADHAADRRGRATRLRRARRRDRRAAKESRAAGLPSRSERRRSCEARKEKAEYREAHHQR